MLKRGLSLNQTWQKCIAMWKEMIEKYWKRGMYGEELKRIYFRNHPKTKVPESKCYFCDFTQHHTENCNSCPGKIVDTRFNCLNVSYHYDDSPKAFYRKILQLDKKRNKK